MKRLLSIILLVVMIFGACSKPSSSAGSEQSSSSAATDSEDTAVEGTAFQDGSVPASSSDISRAEEYSRALAKKGQVFDPAKSVLNLTDPSYKAQEPKDYTIMIYMIGSDLESTGAAATSDLMEIEASGIDFSKNNVLVYTGGSRRWFSDIPCDASCLLDMSREEGDRIIAQTDGNADMGAPLTLSNYINLCTEYYPSEHYMLIFWNHGGGPLMGYGCDELFSYDSLLLSEMTEAMNETIFNADNKLDLVGFDACLMGGLETMSIWSDYADYFIASEELEPGDGWNYDFLSTFNESTDPVEIGSSVVDNYQSYYEAKMSDKYNPDLTLSLIDLSLVPDAVNAVESIASDMTENIGGAQFAAIQRTRDDVKSFGNLTSDDGSDSNSYDLADLYDLAENFAGSYPDSASSIQSAVESMVVKQYASIERAHGVSIYFPLKNKSMYSGSYEIFQNTSVSPCYTRLLESYGSQWTTASAYSWKIGSIESTAGNDFEIELTDEQKENAVSYYMVLFEKDMFDYYTPILSNYKLSLDENGNVIIPRDPEVIVLTNGYEDESYSLWPVSVLEQTDARTVYHLNRTYLANTMDIALGFAGFVTQDVDATVAAKAGSDEVEFLNVSSASGIDSFGKSTVDITGWEVMAHAWTGYQITYDSEGKPLAYTQWNPDSFGLSYFPINDSFVVEKRHLSDLEDSFAIQVLIEDANGNLYPSDLVMISEYEAKTATVATSSGSMTFTLHEDSATFSEYSGSDTSLTIPDSVEGLPVKTISEVKTYNETVTSITLPDTVEALGNNAFSGFRALSDIDLSDHLKVIYGFAFAYTQITELSLPSSLIGLSKNAFGHCAELTSVDLPSSLQILMTGPFMDCPKLETITIDGKASGSCEAFSLVDGVMFTPDGKKLLAYPGGRTGSYTVPDGTEVIGYTAFHNANLSEVILPESLTLLDHFCFYGCKNLAFPELPDSLTEIRSSAFGAERFSIEPTEGSQEKMTIRISAGIKAIGPNAFDLYPARQFEVDPDNQYYSETDGALMNARGDSMLQCASDGTGVMVIPEGTKSFDWETLDYLDLFTGGFLYMDTYHVVIPASVTQMPQGDYTLIDRLYIHTPRGSAAETYAIEHEIPYDDMTDLEYSVHEEAVGEGVARYRVYKDRAALVYLNSEEETITIPDTIEGVPVTIIGNGEDNLMTDEENPYGFTWSSSTKTLNLPDTVVEINNKALNAHTGLTTITIPSGLEVIGNDAFPYSFKLNKIPDTVKYLGQSFAYSNLTIVSIPAGTTFIADDAFANFGAVTSFDVSSDNPNYAAKDGVLFSKDLTQLVSCPDVGTSYDIPEGTVSVRKYAFAPAAATLEKVSLPSSLTTLKDSAFSSCTLLKEVKFSEGLETIGYSVFHGCQSLESISFPSTLRELGGSAFYSCTNLSKVTFNEGLLSIGSTAFKDTPKLTEISLPQSLEKLDYMAFGGSEQESLKGSPFTLRIGPSLTNFNGNAVTDLNVTAFEVDPKNPAYAALDGYLVDKTKTTLIAIPSGLSGTVHLPDGLETLYMGCLSGAGQITDLYIPDSVTEVDSLDIPHEYEDGNWIYSITLHVGKGSAAERYCIDYEIPYKNK